AVVGIRSDSPRSKPQPERYALCLTRSSSCAAANDQRSMSSSIAIDEPVDPDAEFGEEPCSGERGREPGTVVGGCYRILGLLGKGAMGSVYLAHDCRLDRQVAIKCVHPHLLTENFRERLELEARAMARVNHPNVVQVHAYGEHGPAPYFVMEYVGG